MQLWPKIDSVLNCCREKVDVVFQKFEIILQISRKTDRKHWTVLVFVTMQKYFNLNEYLSSFTSVTYMLLLGY